MILCYTVTFKLSI